MGSQGIDETRKLIEAIKGNIIDLIHIDYELVMAEMRDIDAEEAKDLLIDIGSAVIEILAAIKLSKINGTVFSMLLKKVS
jgi:hypothetical protein